MTRGIVTNFVHLGESASAAKWVILSAVLALVGVAGIYFPVPTWVNIGLAVVSLALLALDVVRFRDEQQRTFFVPRVLDDFADVRQRLAGDSRSKFISVGGETLVHDIVLSELIETGGVRATLAASKYVVPSQLRHLGGLYRRRHAAKGSAIFNGPVLGWASSVAGIRSGADRVELVAGTYFDRLATDYFAKLDTRRREPGEPEVVRSLIPGRELFIDRDGCPRDLGDSWLFNGIGVSTLAVTSDGKFVITEQSNRNVGSPGLLAPSGSGSLEPKDFSGATEMLLADLAVAGANRELEEEAAMAAAEVAWSQFLGFGRWLNKSGGPEMFAVTFLNIDSHALVARARRKSERAYVDGQMCVRSSIPFDEWHPESALAILPAELHARMSLPLGAVLTLLVEHVQDRNSRVAQELARRLLR